MKVAELIKQLQEAPQDADVHILFSADPDGASSWDVEEVQTDGPETALLMLGQRVDA